MAGEFGTAANLSPQLAEMAAKIDATDKALSAAAKQASDAKATADAAATAAGGASSAAGSAMTKANAAATAAAAIAVPAPASAKPPAIALDGSPGVSAAYARQDHTHEVKVQRTTVTADANGAATWPYAKAFTVEPSITALVQGTAVDANNARRTVSLEYSHVTSGTGAAKQWIGVTVYATSSRPLPIISGLLTAVISALTGYNTAAPMAGVKISVYAAEPTQ